MSEKNYDVGIYGLWYGRNYGSIITYYALDNIIKSLGYSTVMIKNPLGRANPDYSKMERSHPLLFARGRYEITPFYQINEMDKLNDICDRFLLGSDQMWNYGLSRPYKQTYFFDFVNDEKIKVAFGTSFGREKYNGPDEERPIAEKNLKRFNAISVRDNFSKRICEEEFHVPATTVLDPVFLCPREKYDALINETDFTIDGEYIFAYILDPSPAIGQSILNIAILSGKKVIVVFNESGDKELFRRTMNVEHENIEYLSDPTVQEWLYLFKHASGVITDSFHGSCFSIIYGKMFVVLKNNNRGGERFVHLLGELGLLIHLIEKPEDFYHRFMELGINYKVNYADVYKVIDKENERSLDWLIKALSLDKSMQNAEATLLRPSAVTSILDMEKCVGCSACVNTCPMDALELKPDLLGYYIPVTDEEKCMDCGKCAEVCSALKLPEKKNSKKPKCYAFIAADKEMLFNSSSGGVFGLLAEKAFERQGSVVGAAWNDDFNVEHIVIEERKDLRKLQKSKYLQSYLGKTFRDVKRRLENNQFVLFSGCPCQVAGLQTYLGKDYDNMLTVDLLCGNAPSAMFFQKYMEEEFPQGVSSYEFRHKVSGWNANCVTLTLTDGTTEVRTGGAEDNYQRVYHSHVMCAPHCEQCRYQSTPRYGDITIGDFWGGAKRLSGVDTKKGLSAVLINSAKGEEFFETISCEKIGLKREIPLEWLGGNGFVRGNSNWASPKRDDFYKAIQGMSFLEASNYALKPKHGKPTPFCSSKQNALCHCSEVLHFRYDPSFWEEKMIFGYQTLMVKPNESKRGRFASLPLYDTLKKGVTYRLRMRFKVNSDSDVLNLHIKDSGTNLFQLIYSYKISHKDEWNVIDTIFVPKSKIFDEFMVGALHLKGNGNYLSIDYIQIYEV